MLRVLTYHRVARPDDRPWLTPGLISATPEVFAKQVDYLARHYRVVSLEEVIYANRRAARLPDRAVLITFDDAYRDFAEVAWPILRKYSLPVTLFVPTAYPDRPDHTFWWDRIHQALMRTSHVSVPHGWPIGYLPLRTPVQREVAARRIRDYVKRLPHTSAMASVDWLCEQLRWQPPVGHAVLSWQELRELAEQGVSLAAHSQTHPLLTKISTDQLRREIRGSLDDLQREVGYVPPAFCYPAGAFDERAVAILRSLGVEIAFTTRAGANRLGKQDPLRLLRTNITQRTGPFLFSLRLLPSVAALEAWRRRPVRRQA